MYFAFSFMGNKVIVFVQIVLHEDFAEFICDGIEVIV